jgi:hypothetical protein
MVLLSLKGADVIDVIAGHCQTEFVRKSSIRAGPAGAVVDLPGYACRIGAHPSKVFEFAIAS